MLTGTSCTVGDIDYSKNSQARNYRLDYSTLLLIYNSCIPASNTGTC